MYRLTPRTLQSFERGLNDYHKLFSAKGCNGWELEELFVNAIKSDTTAQHHVLWKEAGHDTEADITVRTNGDSHPIQIKAGTILKKNGNLRISGNRLGRFEGDFHGISDFLNGSPADIIAAPYKKVDNEDGRTHTYSVCYIQREVLAGIDGEWWEEHGKQFVQTNAHGVHFSLRPSMSWQIWWTIPVSCYETALTIEIV